jgi:hypothetical protein
MECVLLPPYKSVPSRGKSHPGSSHSVPAAAAVRVHAQRSSIPFLRRSREPHRDTLLEQVYMAVVVAAVEWNNRRMVVLRLVYLSMRRHATTRNQMSVGILHASGSRVHALVHDHAPDTFHHAPPFQSPNDLHPLSFLAHAAAPEDIHIRRHATRTSSVAGLFHLPLHAILLLRLRIRAASASSLPDVLPGFFPLHVDSLHHPLRILCCCLACRCVLLPCSSTMYTGCVISFLSI